MLGDVFIQCWVRSSSQVVCSASTVYMCIITWKAAASRLSKPTKYNLFCIVYTSAGTITCSNCLLVPNRGPARGSRPAVNTQSMYSQYTVNTQSIYSQYTVNTHSIYSQYTVICWSLAEDQRQSMASQRRPLTVTRHPIGSRYIHANSQSIYTPTAIQYTTIRQPLYGSDLLQPIAYLLLLDAAIMLPQRLLPSPTPRP